ncbi:MAG: PilZ domain-containing protein [Oligoflexia bacterium]|nr:PilZ domain-containing protein [Oligoflexia bacterium]
MRDQQKIRHFPRRKFKYSVGVLHQGSYELCQAHEIGEGGMLIETGLPIKEASLVCVNYFIPEQGFITVMAEIVYSKNNKMFGIKFVDLEFEYRRFIRDYIAQKTKEEAKELAS